MLFDVAVRYSGGVAILKTPGSLTLSSGCEIRPAAVAVCESGHHLILIDCLDTVRADSSGLGEMVAAYSAVIGRGGALKPVERQRPLGETPEPYGTRPPFRGALR